MTSVHKSLSVQLEASVEAMRKNYKKRRKAIEPIKTGELVMLNGWNNRAKHRCKKPEYKTPGPFDVLSTGSNPRYWKSRTREARGIEPLGKVEQSLKASD